MTSRAHVAQGHSAERSGQDTRQVEDADVGQGSVLLWVHDKVLTVFMVCGG